MSTTLNPLGGSKDAEIGASLPANANEQATVRKTIESATSQTHVGVERLSLDTTVEPSSAEIVEAPVVEEATDETPTKETPEGFGAFQSEFAALRKELERIEGLDSSKRAAEKETFKDTVHVFMGKFNAYTAKGDTEAEARYLLAAEVIGQTLSQTQRDALRDAHNEPDTRKKAEILQGAFGDNWKPLMQLGLAGWNPFPTIGGWIASAWNGTGRLGLNRIASTLSAASKKVGPAVMSYRKLRDGPAAKTEAGVRTVAGGVVGAAASYGVYGSALLQNSLYTGAMLSAEVAGASTLGPIGATAVHLTRRGVAARFEKVTKKEFDEAVDLIVAKTHEAKGPVEAELNRAMSKHLTSKDTVLINDDKEQELLKAFHHSSVAAPSQVPYMVTPERYARHCFKKFIELCDKAGAGTYISGLVKNEMEILASYSLEGCKKEAAAIKPKVANVDAHALKEYETKRDQLLQTSIAYGRLIAKNHVDSREQQLSGSVLASSAVGSFMMWNPIPLAVGGAYIGVRRLARKIQSYDGNLEIQPDGSLLGKGGKPIVSVEALKTKGGALYRPDVLREYREEGQLDDDEKAWMKLISISSSILNNRKYHSVDDLALACGPHVQTELSKQKGPAAKVDDQDKQKAKEAYEKADKRLEDLQKEQQTSTDELGNTDDELLLIEPRIIANTGTTDPRLKLQLDQDEVAKKRLEMKKKRLEKRIKDLPGEIKAQEKKVKTLEAAYEKLRKPEGKPMTPEEIGKNEAVIRAFSVKMHVMYKGLEEQYKSGAIAALQTGLKNIATSEGMKKASIEVVKGGTTGILFGGGVYTAAQLVPLIGGITTIFGGPAVVAAIAAIGGMVAYANSRLRK